MIEVPIAPPAPKISAVSIAPPPTSTRSPSPIPENGAGDCLSISDTNKLRAKLGLKPLEVGNSSSSNAQTSSSGDASKSGDGSKRSHEGHQMHKDEWGEFYHKPADNLASKIEAEKLREKFRQKKEKRLLEEKLKKVIFILKSIEGLNINLL